MPILPESITTVMALTQLAELHSLSYIHSWVRKGVKILINGWLKREHTSGAIPMHNGVPQGSVIGSLLLLLFVNDLPDVLKPLTLLFADDAKMVTQGTQKINLYSSLTAAWDWSKKWDLPINPTICNYLTTGREVSLRLSFFPDGSGINIPVSKLVKDQGVQTDNALSPSVQCPEAANSTIDLHDKALLPRSLEIAFIPL